MFLLLFEFIEFHGPHDHQGVDDNDRSRIEVRGTREFLCCRYGNPDPVASWMWSIESELPEPGRHEVQAHVG